MNQDIMSAKEVAEYLNITTTTVMRLIRRQSVKARKFGNTWMIDKQSVEDYKKRNENKSPNDPTRE